MSAAEEPHQKTLAGADRRHRFVPLPVHRIPPHHSSVLFVGGPVNITHMMIAEEDAALFGGTHRALTFLQPSLHQQRRYRPPSPNIGASVEGIAQNVADQALRRNLPDQPRSLDWVGRQLYVMIPEPLKCLTHAPQFPKLSEDELNRFTDPSIGVQTDLAQRVQGIPDRESFEQLATTRFRFLAGEHSLAYDLQFDDTERSFDAQHQLVVEVIQIVDLLLVGNQGSKDLAH